MSRRSRPPSPPIPPPCKISCPATSATPMRRPTRSSGRISAAVPCMAAPSRASAPATAPASRIRSCALPKSPATSFSWSRWGRTPGRCTSPACPAPSRRRCRPPFTVLSPGWSRWSSCAPPTPSNTIASIPPISKILWSLRRCPIFMVPASSMAPAAMRRPRYRALWPVPMPPLNYRASRPSSPIAPPPISVPW